MLELIEKALDAVALTVEFLVEGEHPATSRDRGDDRLDAFVGQAFPDAVGIVTSAPDGVLQHMLGGQAFVEAFKLPSIVGLARGQMEGDAAVFIDRRGVDLGRQSAARASQSLIPGVFLGAPAAC